MSTEDELRDAVARALCEEVGRECADPECHCTAFIPDADAALWGLGIPMSVLAWITANPEAAKGLASGEMVATPAKLLTDWREARAPFLVPAGTSAATPHSWIQLSKAEQALHNFAASPPAPSGKAQWDNPDEDYCPSDLRGPG